MRSGVSDTLAYGLMAAFMFGLAGIAVAQESDVAPPTASQQLQRIHTPQSIDQKLAQLTQDLELTPEQQRQVRPLLQAHHDRIQALFDKNPTVSRQALGPQIHAISDDTHHSIHALLTAHQQDLEKTLLRSQGALRTTTDDYVVVGNVNSGPERVSGQRAVIVFKRV
jgi:Spy/CpxP family protein refolding chaperone